MVTIFLTRHGETQWNQEHRLQGWKDSPLTENGIILANKLGRRLAETSFQGIYTSPSMRAVHTAEYIRSDRDIPILTDPNLKEIYLGEWEGKTKDEIEPQFKKEFSDFWNAPHQYNHQPHKGEGLTEFKQRVEDALMRIIAENSSGNILIVTHAVAIKAILSLTMSIPTEKMWDPPFIHGTSLTIFEWDGGKFRMKLIGDTTHFD
jgi:broad specificity phosphatase PhoE